MSIRTHDYVGTLEIIECASCHMDFGALPQFAKDRRDDHQNFYCPAGHLNHYPQQSERDRLQRKIEQADVQLTRTRARLDQAEAEADAQRRSAIAYKGHLTRTRKRIAAGVCPVPGCKRSGFDKVVAHIASQHGDWLAEHPEVAA